MTVVVADGGSVCGPSCPSGETAVGAAVVGAADVGAADVAGAGVAVAAAVLVGVAVGAALVGVAAWADADAEDGSDVEAAADDGAGVAVVSDAGVGSDGGPSLLETGSIGGVSEASEVEDSPDVVASETGGAEGTVVGATVGTSSVDDGGTV